MSSQIQKYQDQPSGIFKRMPLLTADELTFFKTLTAAIDENHAIFTKIPLENIVHPSLLSDKSYLVHDEIDYLICDKTTSLPICVIDVNFPDYPTPLAYILNTSGIAIVRLEDDITAEELRIKIASTKPITNMKYPGVLADVEVTLVENQREKIIPTTRKARKQLPKITHVIFEKNRTQRLITYGHWIIWTIFTLAVLAACIKGFWR